MTLEVKPEQILMAESPVKGEEELLNSVEDVEDVFIGKNPPSDLVPEADEKKQCFKEESNFFSDLKEGEKKALIELERKVEEAIAEGKLLKHVEEVEANIKDLLIWGVPLSPIKGGESIHVVLLKFLRAREFKVIDAFEMLKNTLRWRRETKVDSILDENEDFWDVFEKAAYIDGIDRERHPICYNVLGAFQDAEMSNMVFGSEEGRKMFLRSRVRLMELGIKQLDMRPGGVSSLLHITDLKDAIGLSRKGVRVTINQAVQLLQDNYPEFVARNVVINAPFWYYALNALLSPFLTQRTKSKFIVVRPAMVTETLLKFIPAEAIPTHYGGLKREEDKEFSMEEAKALDLTIKAASNATIEIPTSEAGRTILWEITVPGWEVLYTAEFMPAKEGSYAIIVQKGKKISHMEEPIRDSFRTSEPGEIIITIENSTSKKKMAFYRYKESLIS